MYHITYAGKDENYVVRNDIIMMLHHSIPNSTYGLNTIENEKINIILGGHNIDKQAAKSIIDSGVRYILYNTEIYTDNGINGRPEKTDWEGSYLPLMKNAESVWDMFIQNCMFLRDINIKSEYVPLGYVKELEEVHRSDQFQYDYYYYGLLSEKRKDILASIKEHSSLVVHEYCSHFLRNAYLSKSMATLYIPQNDVFNHAPATRMVYCATNKIPLIMTAEVFGNDYYKNLYPVSKLDKDWNRHISNAVIAYNKVKEMKFMPPI